MIRENTWNDNLNHHNTPSIVDLDIPVNSIGKIVVDMKAFLFCKIKYMLGDNLYVNTNVDCTCISYCIHIFCHGNRWSFHSVLS